jgi:hypothetical protein
MSASLASVASPLRRLRVDSTARRLVPERLRVWLALAAMSIGFVLVGGGNLDLGYVEARLGLAAREGLAPFGQVYGGWEPGLWPAQV